MSQSLGIAALVLNFASFVASVVGTAIPFWHYASVNGAKTSMGLWQMCISLQGHSQCASFILVSDAIKAVRGLEIIGILLIGGAGLLAILKLFAMKNQDQLPKLSGASAIAAGVFMIVGTIVYGAKYPTVFVNSVLLHLFAGFGVCIVAGVLSLITGTLYFVADNKKQI